MSQPFKYLLVLCMILLVLVGCDNPPADGNTSDGDKTDGDIDEELVDGDKTDGDADTTDGDIDQDTFDGDVDGDADDEAEEDSIDCDGCLIDDVCIPDGQDHPEHSCGTCNSETNSTAWSARIQGTECRAAVGECDVAEVCDGMNLECPEDGFVTDGEVCNDDANACNGVSTCNNGSCHETTDSVTCTALDECHVAGVCDTATGVCSNPNADDGTSCSDDDLDQCVSGVCKDCYDATGCSDLDWGARDSECAEAICSAENTCAFNDAVAGSVCQSDGSGDDSDQCDGAGLCSDCTDTAGCGDYSEDANPCTDLACVANTCIDTNDDTNACDLGHSCTDDHCVSGSCEVEKVTTGCLIEGSCVNEGTSQNDDGCVACDPVSSKTAWSNMDGAVCAVTDDGKPCTDNVCDGGVCVAKNDDTNTCTDEIGCTETTCSNGECVVSGTNTGCYIGSACYAEDTTETDTGNGSCNVCESATAWDGWTTMESGGCDDGNACTHTDTCGTGGVCAGTAYFCSDYGSCNGDGSCTCEDGYAGDYCDQCAGGYFNYPDCQLLTDPSSGFVAIEAGTFWMGSPDGICPDGYPGDCTDELGRESREVLHEVTLTYDFEMSQYETTEAQFEDLMNWNAIDKYDSDCTYGCGDNHPMKYVSWYDALAYANQLSLDHGLTPCYVLSDVSCDRGGNVGTDYMQCFDDHETYGGIEEATVTLIDGLATPQQCEGYRLPTEAEWEYSIRAGTTTAFYNGAITNENTDPNLDLIGWYSGNNGSSGTSDYGSKEVGAKLPNSWGLYDMSGNLAEWTWDRYQEDYQSDSSADPAGPGGGSRRVGRGGYYSALARGERSAYRSGSDPDLRNQYIGFRLCRTTERNHCYNGELDADLGETDIDCGGDTCDPCTTDEACVEMSDCESQNCVDSVCVAATCYDGILNGDEEGEDCGGSCIAPCFMSITAGTFWMGSPNGNCPDGYPGECISEKGRKPWEVLHEVTLTYDIEMSQYETTENNFEDLMGWNPADMYDSDCEYGCGDDHPVKNASWYDALAYANQLSLDQGLTPCYVLSNVSCQRGGGVGSDYINCFDNDATKGGIEEATVTLADGATIPQQCEGYRLPTEAEWEYSIRAGTTTAFYSGKITSKDSDPNMDLIGWYRYNNGDEGESDYGTKPVGGKMPNDWGLYDMSGNIWEWVWDWYQDAYQNDTSTDPSGPGSKTRRVSRGGDWGYSAHYSRSAYRASFPPDNLSQYMGFRLCRTTQRNHCYNGNLDTDLGETDLDCGGGSCTPCTTDQACVEMSDCESQNCVDSVCAAATCDDGIENGNETDVDCGGDSCDPCTTDQACVEMSDCESQNCVDGVCAAASCDDGIENGDEEGVDCGATCQTPCFVQITAGTFWMGSPDGSCPASYPGDCTSELGRGTNEKLHEVTLTYDFEMSRYEIKEAEFEGLMGWNAMDTYDSDCTYGCGDDHPMKYISWFDSVAYANQLSLDQGLTPCYSFTDVKCVNGGNVGTDYMNCFDDNETYGEIDSATVTLADGLTIPQECEGYRLPTEAEWEYSIRAGTTTAFYNGEITDTSTDPNMNLIGWYSHNTDTITHPAGEKDANAWGLYDMSGNLWEWTWDKYCNDYTGYGDDPDGSTCTSLYRPLRGGSLMHAAVACRSAYRYGTLFADRYYAIGARLCRTTNRNSCYNGELDADLGETDLDCGGDSCAPCGTDAACVETSDCESQNCVDSVCAAATCDDGILNGDETDVDCGGYSCDPCTSDMACVEMNDCKSQNCVDSVCVTATCSDGIQNDILGESDVDCGGDTCDPCTADSACVAMTDCESMNCVDSVCAAASCDDGILNGDEEDVDCGATCQTPCFVQITAGTFWMGSPDGNCPEGYPGDCTSEYGRETWEFLHEVTLTYDFEMSRYETTEADFESLMGWNPMELYDPDCEFGCGDDHPLAYITWSDAVAYANQLSLDQGLTPCYVLSNVNCVNGGSVGTDYMNCMDGDETYGGIETATVTLTDGVTMPQECDGYRLPTEAEWEYTIRAGTTTAFYNGGITDYWDDPNLDLIAWYVGNTGTSSDPEWGSHPVGSKIPNAWGLYDMSGNVFELVWDWSKYKYQNDVGTDPVGPKSGSYHPKRGGYWNLHSRYNRSAYRVHMDVDYRTYSTGFRLCRTTNRNSCYNGELDTELGETDLDCGGDTCAPCAADKACVEMSDCESMNCVDSVCLAATCYDGIQNGDEEEVDCGGTCLAPCFVSITAGTFWMGSPDGSCPEGYPGDCTSELGRRSDETLHEVTLTYDFEMSRYEITEFEFEGLTGWNAMDTYDSDCSYNCGDDHPMKYTSWYDALAYANQLSFDQGLTPCYVLSDIDCKNGGNVGTDYMNCFDDDATYGGINSATVSLADGATKPQQCDGFRLPTEAEWEYAIRSGTTTAFYNGDITDTTTDPNLDLIGWYSGNNDAPDTAGYGTKSVGSKNPNSWGLYDMSGNAQEWIWNWYQSDYQKDLATDPVGPESGSWRMTRGGYWSGQASGCRSAYRVGYGADFRSYLVGFRLCRTLQ